MLQHSVLRAADLDAERQVILEEINQHEDDPGDLVHDLFTETLWPGHPLGRPILGTKQSIEAAGRDQVRRFYRKHYVAGNVVVVAAGNLRHEELLELVGEHMDPGSVRAEGPSAWNLRAAGDAPTASGRSLVKKRTTEQAHICVGTSGLSRTDPDRFAFGVVNNALGGGMSSRLFQEVREKRGLAYSVYSYHAMYAEAGVFCAYAGTTPGRAKEVLAIMRAELEDVAEQGPRPRRVRTRQGPHEGLAGPVAGGSGWTHVAPGQVRDRARRVPHREPAPGPHRRRDPRGRGARRRTGTLAADDGHRPRSLLEEGRDRVIRVGVIGACGRMGLMVCRALADSDDFALVAAIDRSKIGQKVGQMIGHPEIDVPVSDELDRLLEANAEVAIDFTHPDVAMDDIRWCISHAVHAVVGTTGITQEDLQEVEKLLSDEGHESNVIVAANFALGAVLMQRFAAQAVRYLPAVEIIELHHEQKADAPSGTAVATVRRIQEERGEAWRGPLGESLEGVRGGDVEGIRVHSVRLPGLVAHQEVIFGGQGQTLTIRHDSTDRSSFMPGVLMAARAVMVRPGLTIGLEPLLDLPPLP